MVDFADRNVGDRPDFYVLDSNAWFEVVNKEIQLQASKGREVLLDEQNVPVWPKQINKSGQPYRGISVNRNQVTKYVDDWPTIGRLLQRA